MCSIAVCSRHHKPMERAFHTITMVWRPQVSAARLHTKGGAGCETKSGHWWHRGRRRHYDSTPLSFRNVDSPPSSINPAAVSSPATAGVLRNAVYRGRVQPKRRPPLRQWPVPVDPTSLHTGQPGQFLKQAHWPVTYHLNDHNN